MRAPALAALLLSCHSAAYAADLHVNPSAGDDTNPASAEQPLKTLNAAMAKAVGGDTIFLQPGDYPAVTRPGGANKHLYTDKYVTIQPAPGVADSRKKISIASLAFGARAGALTGEGRKGVFDLYLRVKGVRIPDGVSVYGGRHLEIIDCRIERAGPHTGSEEAIEKFAVSFGAGDDLTVKDSEITSTAGGVVISGSNNRIINCDIHDITHDGIRAVSSKDSLIESCRIYNLDDGVEDGDPRGVGPDGKGWNRHCDAIHIFIPGPGVPGSQNSRLTIRGNVMYNCESQAIQFNNYLRVKDLWNEQILIENNIFGPTRANVVNIADPVDGIVFRHNTYVHFPEGRTFRGRDRDIRCENHVFRINPACKKAQVYNNILCNSFAPSPDWFAGYNLIVDPKKRTVATRFDKTVPELRFADPARFDGRLPADSPAVDMGTATRTDPKIFPTDIHGTPRDARPDAGAVEIANRKPQPESPPPAFVPPAGTFLDDFADGNTAVDPWLAGKNQLGLAWAALDGRQAWRVMPIGDKLGLSAQGNKGLSWMITAEGADWADLAATVNFRNAYNAQGAGVLLRANAATEGYLVDLAAGRIVKRAADASGKIVETQLAAGKPLLPRTGDVSCTFTIRQTPKGVAITADLNADGTPDLSAEDANAPISAGRLALFCDSPNGSHRTDVLAVKLLVERRSK